MTGRERSTAAERLAGLSDEQLADALVDLGRSLAVPEASGLADAVVRRLEDRRPTSRAAGAGGPTRPRWLPGGALRGTPLRRALLLAVLAALVIATVAAALGIGLPGIRIIFGPAPSPVPTAPASISPASSPNPTASQVQSSPTASPSPTAPSPTSPGAGLSLGRAVSLAEARAAVSYPVGVPDLAGLGPPDAVWLDGSGAEPVVSLSWRPAPGAPASDGVGLLLSEVPGSIDPAYFGKFIGAGTSIVPVAVGDGGWWISGAVHEVAILGPDGNVRFDTIRLAGNVLLWRSGPVTFRLETSLGQDGALEIARSVH